MAWCLEIDLHMNKDKQEKIYFSTLTRHAHPWQCECPFIRLNRELNHGPSGWKASILWYRYLRGDTNTTSYVMFIFNDTDAFCLKLRVLVCKHTDELVSIPWNPFQSEFLPHDIWGATNEIHCFWGIKYVPKYPWGLDLILTDMPGGTSRCTGVDIFVIAYLRMDC